MTAVVSPAQGPDPQGRSRASWASTRRKALREQYRYQCIPDPNRPGKRINPHADVPHGTVGGYDNWGCQCEIVPGTGMRENPVPGCEAAKRAQLAERRETKRAAAVTKPIRIAIGRVNTPPPPGDRPSGRHRKSTP